MEELVRGIITNSVSSSNNNNNTNHANPASSAVAVVVPRTNNNNGTTRTSRPNSLLGPERESIAFQVNLVGAPPEVERLVENIKHVADQFLYHWKTFPIVLPNPLCAGGQPATTTTAATTTTTTTSNASFVSATNSSNRKARPINLRDLFIAPPFDELDAVATDNHGEPRRLTLQQLKSLRERGLQQKDKMVGKAKKLTADQLETIRLRGEFEVPSLNFAGQTHKWQLSQFLQKGTERAHDSLLCDLALAARFLVVTAKARVLGHFFSVAQALRALWLGLQMLADMLVGLPSLLAQDLEYKIKEERCRFLVAELVCRPELEDHMDALTTYVRRELRRAEMEKFEMGCESALPIPYLFLTPSGQDVDLRLFSRDIMQKALPILSSILERETRGWFLHFRERLIAELRERKMTDGEIEEAVNEAVMQEYLQRVYNAILSNNELNSLGAGIAQLLVQQAQSVVIMYKAMVKIQREVKHTRDDQTKHLHESYPVLSRISPWLRSKQSSAELSQLASSTWSAHEEAINICAKHNLQQTIYFLSRDMAFMKEREPILLKELKDAKTPTRSFQWSCRIWRPKSWIVRRNFQGQTEVMPTVISQQATSIVTPRSDPSQPVFLVEKEVSKTTSTRWPLWRLVNLIMRTWCWTWNIMFVLGVIVPWCSPLGLRALFCVKPFMPDLELSQINGTLFPRKTSITQTLASMLLELWRDISKSRTHFETEPDTGFIGKGMTRHINRVWNYFVKGFIGTLLILVCFPLLCIFVVTLSVCCAILAPLWMPLVTVVLHLYMMLVYDLDSPDETRNKYCRILEALIWNVAIQGCLQPVFAVLVAVFICPIISIVIAVFGLARYGFRLCWDSTAYHFFIKKCGRVPASDSVAVHRIAGPGLNSDYYFVIKPEQALAAFEAKMELDELQAYQHAIETVILQPQKDYSQFVEACFGPFSAQLSKTNGPYKGLERESQDLLATLHEKLEKRRRDLQTGLTTNVKTKIKMRTMDLKIVIQQGAHLLERFYPGHVISRLSMSTDEFWDCKSLAVGDWAGLAGQLFVDVFGLDFLTPVGDHETQFKLEAHSQLDLSRYTEMVQTASDIMGVNGPDLLDNLYAPRGNIQVQSPYLELSAFNPRSRITTTFRKPEKKVDPSSGWTTPRIRAKRSLQQQHQQNTQQDDQLKLHGNRTASWRPWKRHHGDRNPSEKLLIPLPIPHPVHIAILINNRDSEQPIPLDSLTCWQILKSIEDCQGDLQLMSATVGRYRGGGGDAGIRTMDSSMDSLPSQTSNDSRLTRDDSLDGIVGASETLPCGNKDLSAAHNRSTIDLRDHRDGGGAETSYHWTLNNWGAAAAAQTSRRSGGNLIVGTVGTNQGGGGGGVGVGGVSTQMVRVDLASPEDISLDTDSSRAIYSNVTATALAATTTTTTTTVGGTVGSSSVYGTTV